MLKKISPKRVHNITPSSGVPVCMPGIPESLYAVIRRLQVAIR